MKFIPYFYSLPLTCALFSPFLTLCTRLPSLLLLHLLSQSLRRRHCCAGVVSLRVPSEEASAHDQANGGNVSGGALGSSLAHVHLAMYPLWGNPSCSSSSSSTSKPPNDSSNTEAAVTHYLALLVNLNQQLPQMRPHAAINNTSGGVRTLPPAPAAALFVGNSGENGCFGGAMAAQSK